MSSQPVPVKQSYQVQILESGDESGLKYKATEKEWTELLTHAGLLTSNNENKAPLIKLTSPTLGGPGDTENIDNKDNLSNDEEKKHTPYFVISIMGPQSSGKSTILNLLFGCRFDVMDHTKGRKQITTGIWIDASPKTNNLLVMDLEGTDAIERKKNRGNFERQTSLMALTLSEVLIVNMWACDIGRASGMNVDTLRSILEANLRLFSPNTKTLLLFLIREQSPDETQFGVTPASVQEATIRKIVDDIWNNIEKPESYSKTNLSDLFDIQFFFMPPLVFFREKFHERVQELFRRFTDPKDPNYYFNSAYHFRKSVPPEGLFTWTSQIWDAISKDESLNIPDQQKLLSSYRCEHAMNQAFKTFYDQSAEIQRSVQSQYVENFGSRFNVLISKCIYEYCMTANKYDKDEANDKYAQLVDKIETNIQYLLSFQMKHLISKCAEKYEKDIHKSLPKNECSSDFRNIVSNISSQIEKDFAQQMEKCMINSDNTLLLDTEARTDELKERLHEITKSVQLEQLQLLEKENDSLLDEHLSSQMSKIIRGSSSNIWSRISSLRIQYHGSILKNILIKFDNLMYDNELKDEKRQHLRDKVDEQIISSCKQYVERMDTILIEQYDHYFNKDETTGIPRDWNSSVNVKDIFTKAKEKCSQLLEACETITLEENKDLNLPLVRLRLLKSERINDINTNFDRYCDNEYRKVEEMIRRREFGGGILPSNPITWIVFLFFAWNEIWSMLKNPLLLVTFIFALIILLIIYQAHALGFNVQAVGKGILQKILNIVGFKFQQLLDSHSTVINNRKQMHKARQNSKSSLSDNEDRISSGNITPQ